MNPQQEAVALYLYLEKRGFKPSVRSVSRALRDQGMRFREIDLRGWLGAFLKTRDASGTQTEPVGTSREPKSVLAGTTTEPAGTSWTQPGRVFARASKVSLISTLSPNGDGDPAPQRLPLRKEPSTSDLAAYRIMDAAYPVIRQYTALQQTQKRWKQINKAGALDLAELNTAPEEVVRVLTLAYTDERARRYYGGIATLSKLAEHWHKIIAVCEDDPEETESERRKAYSRGDFLPRV